MTFLVDSNILVFSANLASNKPDFKRFSSITAIESKNV